MRKVMKVVYSRISRKWCIIAIFIMVFFTIFGPSYFRQLLFSLHDDNNVVTCNFHMIPPEVFKEADDLNAVIENYIPYEGIIDKFVPFVGNGYFGISLNEERLFYIEDGRMLSVNVPYYPVVEVQLPWDSNKRAVLSYMSAIVAIYSCFSDKVHVTHKFIAHRTLPNLFIQEICIKNFQKESLSFNLVQSDLHNTWNSVIVRNIQLNHTPRQDVEYVLSTGTVLNSQTNKYVLVSILTQKFPLKINMDALGTLNLTIYTGIEYMLYVKKGSDDTAKRQAIENRLIENLKSALNEKYDNLKDAHITAWKNLWNTGLSISHSKAIGTINGDSINATLYYVLSSVRDRYQEISTSFELRDTIVKYLSDKDGCYASNHHTLEAQNLWIPLSSMENINNVVNLWLLTLEKQGCYSLVKSGATGIVQAMVLSFGSFQFSKLHLAFNLHPQFLHRNYYFRRIQYGNNTHINVTVEVQDDNKAVLYASALDTTGKQYFACDAACLADPVPLSSSVSHQFPVKLTKPFTSILYITPDKQHMEDLRRTLHVKEVAEGKVGTYNSPLTSLLDELEAAELEESEPYYSIAMCLFIIIYVFICAVIVLSIPRRKEPLMNFFNE